jgi:hypothetical protein
VFWGGGTASTKEPSTNIPVPRIKAYIYVKKGGGGGSPVRPWRRGTALCFRNVSRSRLNSDKWWSALTGSHYWKSTIHVIHVPHSASKILIIFSINRYHKYVFYRVMLLRYFWLCYIGQLCIAGCLDRFLRWAATKKMTKQVIIIFISINVEPNGRVKQVWIWAGQITVNDITIASNYSLFGTKCQEKM